MRVGVNLRLRAHHTNHLLCCRRRHPLPRADGLPEYAHARGRSARGGINTHCHRAEYHNTRDEPGRGGRGLIQGVRSLALALSLSLSLTTMAMRLLPRLVVLSGARPV